MKTVTRTSIQQNLCSLDGLFTSATTPRKSMFYAKLAILELCGWIEETMDRIVSSCANRMLREQTNRKNVEDNTIGRTYGFEYKEQFRRMLIQVIGLRGVERMERCVDATRLQALKSTLGALKPSRDVEAHTYLIAATRTINAPSVTLKNFKRVYDGLCEIDQVLRKSGF